MKPMDGLELWRAVTLGAVKSADPDLTQRQMALLLTVYLTPPPHTVRGLAAILGVGKPVITRALDSMSIAGLLKRRRDDADKRNVLVERTDKGSMYLNDFGERVAAALGSTK
jgi:DNA-binding MarR family transcriptional regulator